VEKAHQNRCGNEVDSASKSIQHRTKSKPPRLTLQVLNWTKPQSTAAPQRCLLGVITPTNFSWLFRSADCVIVVAHNETSVWRRYLDLESVLLVTECRTVSLPWYSKYPCKGAPWHDRAIEKVSIIRDIWLTSNQHIICTTHLWKSSLRRALSV